MNNSTLITTLYNLEPVLVCVTRLSPSKIIILTEENAVDRKVQAENTLEATFGKVIEIKKTITSLYDPVRVAKDVVDIIEKEHALGRGVLINVSGGRKPQAFGALYGAFARSDMVKKVVYVTEEDNFMIEFPILSFNLSPTKKMILEIIQNGNVAVENIAATIGISKGMTYNHLRELKTMGYISDDGGYSLTDSGRLAVI
ncbi:CRISPR-associated CARF protein Csa3 [Methanolobus bombayensis]|uniref:CRISPR-associated CARF protein Csa3 n=1 Tax=Methanolobus bombayensis TaxID=38023 RepID=UPI001AE6DD63|nr:CRISPR-associated CARF protein Csa3 [Methanolobus bombayensis]MBP1908577.1 CRISPR-associated protein Csa3 [Methanolobus bombayensis]